MNAFMSSTDNDHINANHNFSIVGNKDGKFEGITKEDLPCGGIFYKDAKLILQDPQENKEWIKEAKQKILSKYQREVTSTKTAQLTDRRVRSKTLGEMSNEEFQEYMNNREPMLNEETLDPIKEIHAMTDDEYDQFRIEWNHYRVKRIDRIKDIQQPPLVKPMTEEEWEEFIKDQYKNQEGAHTT
jgi:hypothetical protein